MFTGVVAGAAPIAIMPAIGKKMLRINVIVDEVNDLKSDRNVCMITFHGDAESEYFKGKILPGGVDTQRSVEGGMLLSARYMLEGIDMNAPEGMDGMDMDAPEGMGGAPFSPEEGMPAEEPLPEEASPEEEDPQTPPAEGAGT